MRRVMIPAVLLLLAGCAATPEAAPTTTPTPTLSQKLADAASVCSLPSDALQDDGATLLLDGQGKDDRYLKDGELKYKEGTLTTQNISCALSVIDTPSSIITKMEQTRALDGRQEETAGDFSYSWTYHPDSGLDVIVTRQ